MFINILLIYVIYVIYVIYFVYRKPGAKIIKKNTKLGSKQTSNVPCY